MPIPGIIASPNSLARVFNVVTYTGTGASRTVTTNIDTRNGLVLAKARSSAEAWMLLLEHGGSKWYRSTNDAYSSSPTSTTDVTPADGSVTLSGTVANTNATTYVMFAGKKKAGFMDRVEYTGNAEYPSGNMLQTINHSLGATPGAVLIAGIGTLTGHVDEAYFTLTKGMVLSHRATTASTPWRSYQQVHNGLVLTDSVELIHVDSTTFRVGHSTNGADGGLVNALGVKYVAWLFAHDESPTGQVYCGHYTGNGSATGPTVTVGWMPRFLLVFQDTDGSSNECGIIADEIRTPDYTGSSDAYLRTSRNEAEQTGNFFTGTSTGFTVNSSDTLVNKNNVRYPYIAIRWGAL